MVWRLALGANLLRLGGGAQAAGADIDLDCAGGGRDHLLVDVRSKRAAGRGSLTEPATAVLVTDVSAKDRVLAAHVAFS